MSSTERDRDHIRLLLQVARLYYEEELDQSAIGQQIGYSRPTISRLLAEARARRIVRFTISHPMERALEYEAQLRRRFALRHAAVAIVEDVAPARAVGRLAGEVIADHGGPGTLLALSNGTSLRAVVEAMPTRRWPYSCVIQMIGSLGRIDQQLVDSPELCRRMAKRLGGIHRPLPVPIVLGSAAVAASVRQEEVVLTTLELAARSDIALSGVGAVGTKRTTASILQPFMTPEIEAEVRRGRAVAHICGHYLDAEGRHVPTSLCDRMITMEPERLADIDLAMVVAWGLEKVPALHAVMRAGFVSSLVTDDRTAHLLLDFER